MAGTIVSDTLQDGAGNSTATTNAIQGSAKAWLSATWNGTTMTVNSSFNVSSVTRASAGQYTITMTTALASANYAVVGVPVYSATYTNPVMWQTISTAPTTTVFNITTAAGSFAAADPAGLSIAVFR